MAFVNGEILSGSIELPEGHYSRMADAIDCAQRAADTGVAPSVTERPTLDPHCELAILIREVIEETPFDEIAN